MKLRIRLRKMLLQWVAPAMMASATADAVIVAEWGYQVDSGFTDFGPTVSEVGVAGVVGDTPNFDLAGLPTRLRWGRTGTTVEGAPVFDPAVQSKLSVTPTINSPPSLFTSTDGIFDPGDFVSGLRLTYSNFVVSDASLDHAELLIQIVLTPNDPPGLSLPAFVTSFSIKVKESATGDILVLENPGILTAGFLLKDTDYTIQLRPDGLGQLSDDQCLAASASPGCVGLITVDGKLNEMQAYLAIEGRSRPIPEPTMMMLFGLMFAGIAVAACLRS